MTRTRRLSRQASAMPVARNKVPSNPEVPGINGAANTMPHATRVNTRYALSVALAEFRSDMGVAVETCILPRRDARREKLGR